MGIVIKIVCRHDLQFKQDFLHEPRESVEVKYRSDGTEWKGLANVSIRLCIFGIFDADDRKLLVLLGKGKMLISSLQVNCLENNFASRSR